MPTAYHVSGDRAQDRLPLNPELGDLLKLILNAVKGTANLMGWSTWPRQGVGVEGCGPFLL